MCCRLDELSAMLGAELQLAVLLKWAEAETAAPDASPMRPRVLEGQYPAHTPTRPIRYDV